MAFEVVFAEHDEFASAVQSTLVAFTTCRVVVRPVLLTCRCMGVEQVRRYLDNEAIDDVRKNYEREKKTHTKDTGDHRT